MGTLGHIICVGKETGKAWPLAGPPLDIMHSMGFFSVVKICQVRRGEALEMPYVCILEGWLLGIETV